MPPPTQFNGQFLGDYSGLAAYTDAHPLWMDTRNPDLFVCPGVSPPSVCTGTTADGRLLNTQDIYTATEGVPSK